MPPNHSGLIGNGKGNFGKVVFERHGDGGPRSRGTGAGRDGNEERKCALGAEMETRGGEWLGERRSARGDGCPTWSDKNRGDGGDEKEEETKDGGDGNGNDIFNINEKRHERRTESMDPWR